jgi:MFS family permease
VSSTIHPRPPLSAGALFDQSFHLYRRNFLLFVGITAPIVIPQTLILVVLFAVSTNASNAGSALNLAFLPAAYAVASRWFGRSVGVGQVYGWIGMGTFGLLIVGAVLLGLMVAVGLVLLIVPGFYLWMRFLFVPQAIVLERATLAQAFSRSAQLVRGSWWRVFGIFLLCNSPAIPGVVVVGILQLLVKAAFGAHAGDVWLLFATGLLIPLFIWPIPMSALTMLYYDLRVRQEGFDIDRADAGLGVRQPA